MRNVLLLLAVSASPLFVGCASESSADQNDEPVVESTDEALAASQRKVTTHYTGTFTESGETFTVALDVELPSAAIGYQKMDSNRWKPSNGSPFCRVYNEWTPGTMTLRVTGAGGRVVAENTQSTGTSGFEQLDASRECPDGFLTNARTFSKLGAELSEEGVGFEKDGKAIHVPRGYFSPSFVTVNATSTFRALSAGKVTHESSTGYNESDYEVPRGIIQVSLPQETVISIGINPSMQGRLGYERTVDVTLRARGW